MKEIWVTLLEALGQAWWVEVITEAPRCTYYFGPFASASEAEAARGGYVEDLEQENAQNIRAIVKRCKPVSLTIEHEAETGRSGKPTSLISSRA
ncbi:MAG: DUF1816 domain-containing protein [Leptolyngbyaceae cyanobacterium SM1_3_5]|nr:DUF1816 domain-containing protein [Leptolyngbyaceae cyanobacterium SM1_3_5]